MNKSMSERTADAILQKDKTIVIAGKTYNVAPPCCATLIEVSKRIPDVPLVDVMGNMMNEALAAAKDSRAVFEQLAVLILGAKVVRDDKPSGLFHRGRYKTKLERLTDDLMYELSPSEANALRDELLAMMEVQDFFALTASLQEISLIQRTRAAETTVSGL